MKNKGAIEISIEKIIIIVLLMVVIVIGLIFFKTLHDRNYLEITNITTKVCENETRNYIFEDIYIKYLSNLSKEIDTKCNNLLEMPKNSTFATKKLCNEMKKKYENITKEYNINKVDYFKIYGLYREVCRMQDLDDINNFGLENQSYIYELSKGMKIKKESLERYCNATKESAVFGKCEITSNTNVEVCIIRYYENYTCLFNGKVYFIKVKGE